MKRNKRRARLRDFIEPAWGPVRRTVVDPIRKRYPTGLKDPAFSNIWFITLLIVLGILLFRLPSSSASTKRLQIYVVITLASIFTIMAISLNLHTGMAGMVNFGVIFFVGIGAISTSLLTVNFGWNPFAAMFAGVVISGVLGYFLAYPTVRLRVDYFAIVTIALGEVLRVMLKVEPWLRNRGDNAPSGIANFRKPFDHWWRDTFTPWVSKHISGPWFGTEFTEGYIMFMAFLSLLFMVLIFFSAQLINRSPFGRVLKTIREDEEVAESYGYNVFRYKAVALGLGAAMAAVAGSLWAWQLGNIFPSFMNPATSTFLVWAAFVIGGRANNKGMVIGAYLIIIADIAIRNLEDAAAVDDVFRWIVVDLIGGIFGEETILNDKVFGSADAVHLDTNFLRIMLIGLVIMIFMLFFEKGLLPELPYRPLDPKGLGEPKDLEMEKEGEAEIGTSEDAQPPPDPDADAAEEDSSGD